MAESRDRSSSTEPQLKFPGFLLYRRLSDTHFHCQQSRLNEGLTLCKQEAPCDVCKDWLPEALEALEKAAQQKRKHKAAVRAGKKSQEMDNSIEIHAPDEGIKAPPAKRRDDGSSKTKKRAESATLSKAQSANQPSRSRDTLSKATEAESAGPVTRRRPFHPAALWWEDPGLTAVQCLLGPTDLNTIDHAVVIGADEVTGRRDITTHRGPATCPDVEGVGSRPGPRLREGPSLEPGTLIWWMLRGLVVLRGGWRRSGLLVLPLIVSFITQGHRRIVGPGPDLTIMTDLRVWTAWGLGRHMCPDLRYSCPQQHHRRLRREPSPWSLCLPDQHTRTIWQVWRAWPTRQLWPTWQVWWARQTRQRHTSQQSTSQQGISGQKWRSRRLCTTQQLLPTQHRIRTWQLPTQHAHRTQLVTTRHIHKTHQVMTRHTHRTQHVTTRQGWRAGSPGYRGRDCASC